MDTTDLSFNLVDPGSLVIPLNYITHDFLTNFNKVYHDYTPEEKAEINAQLDEEMHTSSSSVTASDDRILRQIMAVINPDYDGASTPNLRDIMKYCAENYGIILAGAIHPTLGKCLVIYSTTGVDELIAFITLIADVRLKNEDNLELVSDKLIINARAQYDKPQRKYIVDTPIWVSMIAEGKDIDMGTSVVILVYPDGVVEPEYTFHGIHRWLQEKYLGYKQMKENMAKDPSYARVVDDVLVRIMETLIVDAENDPDVNLNDQATVQRLATLGAAITMINNKARFSDDEVTKKVIYNLEVMADEVRQLDDEDPLVIHDNVYTRSIIFTQAIKRISTFSNIIATPTQF